MEIDNSLELAKKVLIAKTINEIEQERYKIFCSKMAGLLKNPNYGLCLGV